MSCPSCNETTRLHANLARLNYCFFPANCGLFCQTKLASWHIQLYISLCAQTPKREDLVVPTTGSLIVGAASFTPFGSQAL